MEKNKLGNNKYGMKMETHIHVLRATKRMTQQELADLVNVSRQTIIQLESNRFNPSYLMMVKIANVFNVKTDDLCTVTVDSENELDSE